MRKIIFIVIIVFLLVPFACKKERNKTVTIIRDCTGTYIRMDEKNYRVCNLEKVSSFPDGATAIVTFKKIKECNGSAKDQIVCLIGKENEGWIEVDKIK